MSWSRYLLKDFYAATGVPRGHRGGPRARMPQLRRNEEGKLTWHVRLRKQWIEWRPAVVRFLNFEDWRKHNADL